MSSVRISSRGAAALLAFACLGRTGPEVDRAVAELKRSLAPRSPKPITIERRKEKRSKKATRREETSAIYAAVEKRADGKCESCGLPFSPSDPPELDHQAGRGRARQTVENTWLLHGRSCHRAKTNPSGGARAHLERFIAHAERRGYRAEAERARARLEGIVSLREATR